jgi:hypothetical protein
VLPIAGAFIPILRARAPPRAPVSRNASPRTDPTRLILRSNTARGSRRVDRITTRSVRSQTRASLVRATRADRPCRKTQTNRPRRYERRASATDCAWIRVEHPKPQSTVAHPLEPRLSVCRAPDPRRQGTTTSRAKPARPWPSDEVEVSQDQKPHERDRARPWRRCGAIATPISSSWADEPRCPRRRWRLHPPRMDVLRNTRSSHTQGRPTRRRALCKPP